MLNTNNMCLCGNPEFSWSYLLSHMALFQLEKAESWRKKNTHSHSTNRACVRSASEWVVVGILYSTTHRLALPICVAPRQSGSPYIFPTLFEKIDLLFRTFLLSFYLSFFLPSFLSFLQTKVFRTWQCFPSSGCMAKYDEILSEEAFLKSVNLQYIKLGCLDDGTNESLTNHLMF